VVAQFEFVSKTHDFNSHMLSKRHDSSLHNALKGHDFSRAVNAIE
jgi:hypothetical protein